MQLTLRKIIEDNEVGLNLLNVDTTKVKQEADYLEACLPKSVSIKTRIRIACSLLQTAVMYNK